MYYFKVYETMTKSASCHPDVWTNLACCYFMLGMYPEAKAAADKGREHTEESIDIHFDM